jgi:CheY-like chemotaxis protein
MPAGGALTISVQEISTTSAAGLGLAPGEYQRLSVIDTGVGMDAATLRRAVEPFYSTKGVGKGTGLGLSMVHGLAAQLGGAFVLTSAPGEGTRADIYLPRADRDAAAVQARPEVIPQKPARSLRLLLVDDEDLVRTGTAEMLRELGHEVTEARGGGEALRQLDSGLEVDAVVTDYKMPRMDGGQLARAVKERCVSTAVLIITGYAGGRLQVGLPVLAKPFRQADLGKALQDLVGDDAATVVPLRRTPGRSKAEPHD